MSDTWARLDNAWVEHATVAVMIETYGDADLESGDENRVALRLSEGSDGVVLYGTPTDFMALANKIRERYGK